MSTFLWGLGAIAGLLVLAGLAEAWYKRHRRYPLSSHHPHDKAAEDDKDTPLGLEATDLKSVRRTLIFNDRLAGQSGAGGTTFAGIKTQDRGKSTGTRRPK